MKENTQVRVTDMDGAVFECQKVGDGYAWVPVQPLHIASAPISAFAFPTRKPRKEAQWKRERQSRRR